MTRSELVELVGGALVLAGIFAVFIFGPLLAAWWVGVH
jgi:hypothetical protein